MPTTPIGEMLKAWEKHRIEQRPKIIEHVPVSEDDAIKLAALAELYQLPKEDIIANLITHALHEVEEKMPYVQGPNVIRTEEGDPVYEDIGKTPSYLKIKAKLKQEMLKSTKQKTV